MGKVNDGEPRLASIEYASPDGTAERVDFEHPPSIAEISENIHFGLQRIGLAERHMSLDDFKEFWGLGVLNNTAYVCLLLEHLRLNEQDPQKPFSLDIDQFINAYGQWVGFTTAGNDRIKSLRPRDIWAAISALEAKGLWTQERPSTVEVSRIG